MAVTALYLNKKCGDGGLRNIDRRPQKKKIVKTLDK